jgi:hypothetical protein
MSNPLSQQTPSATPGGASGNVVPVVATANLTAQAFGVFNTASPVTLVAAAAGNAGTYRVSIYLVITTTFVTNTAVTMAFGWTDDNGAQTVTYTGGALTAGTTIVGSQLIRSTGAAAVTYTPAKTGSAATAGAAAFSVVVERVI